MPVAVYPALVKGDAAQGFRGRLVDFSDLEAHGADVGALLSAAREQLHARLAELDRRGDEWPTPTALDALVERQMAEHAVAMLIDVPVEDTPVRVNISIGERLLRRLDEAAEAQTMTRSGFIAAAVRQRLGEPAPGAEKAGGSQRLREEVVELRRRVNEAVGPESAFGRTLADLDARALEGLRLFAGGLASRWEDGRRDGERREEARSGEDGRSGA